MIEDAIQFASDWHAFWLLVEWGIFVGIMAAGILAWIVLKVLK